MKGIQRIIEAVRSESPLLDLIKSGISPDRIKDAIIADFDPFFINKDSLQKHATTYLVSDWILFNKYRNDNWFLEKLTVSLDIYRSAQFLDAQACFEMIKHLVNDQLETGNRFWSFVLTETKKSDLELFEFAQTVMGDIGKIVEGLSKINLVEYISMLRISNGKPVIIDEVKKLDLGVLNNELIQNPNFKQLFTVMNLKLSDWRNVAYHHNYSVRDDKISCTYGPKDNRSSIVLSRHELWEVLSHIVKIVDVLNLTHKLFFYDNENDILKSFNPALIDSEGRVEIWFLTFASGLAAQGFEVIEFETNDDLSKIVVKELIADSDARTRAIHSSQFTYNLWYFTSSKNLEVEYRLIDDKPYLIATTTSEICEKIGSDEKPFSYLAKHINFKILEE